MTKQKRTFLTAEWRKLILANYELDPSILLPYLPYKTELDLWDDTCYVSLVGFMFLNTKVLGIPIPFHRNFEEVNLRFYVRHKEGNEWKRGVVFVKEIVPKAAITFVANNLYKEHYQTAPMRHSWDNSQALAVNYDWNIGDRWHHLKVDSDHIAQAFAENSEEAFITEHYWGYTKIGERLTYEYAVEHPTWQAYPVSSYDINIDCQTVYGDAFKGLTRQQPKSVFLAEGSEIIVRGKSNIR